MAKELRGVHVEEFSLVRGSDLQPANPEATTAFYKATAKEKGSMAEQTQTPAPAAPAPGKQTMAKMIANAVRVAIQKATTTRVSEYTSQSRSTDTWTEESAPAAEPVGDGSGSTTIVITDAVGIEKTAPAAGTAAAPGGEPEDGAEVAKAIEPLVKTVLAIDARLAKMEKAPVGSRILKAGNFIGLAEVSDNGGAKFPEFTKYLEQVSKLSPGQRISKATITSSGWTYGLSFVEGGNFIDYVVDQSVLLKRCRTVKMKDKKQPIDKIGLGAKVLKKGTPGTDPGDTVSVSGPTQIVLDAEEVIAIVSIGDDTLEDNIEGEGFVQHLLGMIGRAAANELEQMGIHGDKDVADEFILDRLNGWYKLAIADGAHVIDAMADDDRFWPGLNAKKATRLIKALPSKYRQDLRALGMILNNDLYLDYNDELATKGYSDAWQAITGMTDLPVRSIPNVRVPMLKTDVAFASGGENFADGTFVMLTALQNLIFGVHRDIRIEPFRQPRKRCTDYVLTMRCAAQIENGDAIAIYDHAAVRP